MQYESLDGAAPEGAVTEMIPPGGEQKESRAHSGEIMAGAALKTRLISPVLATFLGAMILANVGGMMFYPLLPLYLRELDAGVSDIGIYFTLSMIVPLAMQIAGGWASDRLGRLKSVAIGSVAGAVGWIGVILAPSWGWLLVGQSIGAIAGAFVAPSFDAFIAEQSDEKNRARVFAVSQTIFQVVAVIGPLAGGLAVKTLGWKGLILIAAGLYFSATAIRLYLARTHKPAIKPSGTLSLKDFGASFKTMGTLALSGGLITWLIISDGVRDISMGLSGNLLPVFLQEQRGIDIATIGLLNALLGGASMLVMIPAGHFADRFGERYAIAAGYTTAFIAFALMLLVPSPWAAGAAFIIFGMGIGMLSPAYQSLISKAVPEHLRGIAFGFLSTSNGFIALPAPWLGAMLWKGVAPIAPFWITASAMLLIVPPVLAKFKLPAATIATEAAAERQDTA
ncbi:MAG: MFS transporter [Spirochaetales bacterium]|nr:MFS transporter [Spirochaetales bacterium]